MLVRDERRAAPALAALAGRVFGAPLPVGVRAWDGSSAGATAGPRVVLRRRALRHLLWSPGELGMARAFVSCDLDVDGDLREALQRSWELIGRRELRGWRPGPSTLIRALPAAARLGAIGPRPPIPACEASMPGRLHSRDRDRAAIAHHYDLGNDFYSMLLDPTMSYSCGYFRTGDEELQQAQQAKLDVICRKLALRQGARLLDVGCGWGSLILYAAHHYGVRATGVTLSAQQYEHILRSVEQLGLGELVDVRLCDYRDLRTADDSPYDAVASIEMSEHVGAEQYPEYLATLHRMLRPGGRMLLQQMARGTIQPGGGAFIRSYIAPDMTMVPASRTVARLEAAGFEPIDLESLREHYVRTIEGWLRTLREQRGEAQRLLGSEQRYRVWLLYLTGGMLAFEENRMGVHQFLVSRAMCGEVDSNDQR